MSRMTYLLLPFLFLSPISKGKDVLPANRSPQTSLERGVCIDKDEPIQLSLTIKFVNTLSSAITVYGPTGWTPTGPVGGAVTVAPNSEGILNTSIWITNGSINSGITLSFNTDLQAFVVSTDMAFNPAAALKTFEAFGDRSLFLDPQFLRNNYNASVPITLYLNMF